VLNNSGINVPILCYSSDTINFSVGGGAPLTITDVEANLNNSGYLNIFGPGVTTGNISNDEIATHSILLTKVDGVEWIVFKFWIRNNNNFATDCFINAMKFSDYKANGVSAFDSEINLSVLNPEFTEDFIYRGGYGNLINYGNDLLLTIADQNYIENGGALFGTQIYIKPILENVLRSVISGYNVPPIFSQRLFFDNINFSATPAIVPDSISGFDAELVGSNRLVLGTIPNPTTGSVNFNTSHIDLLNNFTLFIKGEMGSSSLQPEFFMQGGFVWQNNNLQNILRINGGLKGLVNFNGGIIDGRNMTLVLKKSGTTYKMFQDGALLHTAISTTVASSPTANTLAFQTANVRYKPECYGIVNTDLSDIDILAIGNDYNAIRNVCIANSAISNFYGLSEGNEDALIDTITSNSATVNDHQWEVSTDKYLANLAYGFDLYTNDLFPADATKNILVPLKFDNTSFNKIIIGYTKDLNSPYLQNGNSFLNCETLLDNSAINPIYDPSGFYTNPVGFEDLVLENETYINKILIGNKITDLTLDM